MHFSVLIQEFARLLQLKLWRCFFRTFATKLTKLLSGGALKPWVLFTCKRWYTFSCLMRNLYETLEPNFWQHSLGYGPCMSCIVTRYLWQQFILDVYGILSIEIPQHTLSLRFACVLYRKQCVQTNSVFDFLQEIVSKVPDIGAETTGEERISGRRYEMFETLAII